MRTNMLTKKEIASNIIITRRYGFGNGFAYNCTVRGFVFETLTDAVVSGELYETDNKGHMTKVSSCKNKKEIVNAIYEWFKSYAADQFDKY